MQEGSDDRRIGVWETFIDAHPQVVPAISTAFNHLTERVRRVEQGDLKGVVSMLLIGVRQDATSIMTLCSHSNVIGAHQLLRCLFEKVVVALYLKTNPAQLEDFLDFDAIHWTRVLDRIKANTGIEMGDPESAASLKDRNDRARKKFRQEKCKECKRPGQLAWTAKDTETMAREVGLADQYLFCFTEPTHLLHCTFYGVRPHSQQDDAIRLPAILGAVHVFLILAITLHYELYDPGVPRSESAASVYAAWRDAWPNTSAG